MTATADKATACKYIHKASIHDNLLSDKAKAQLLRHGYTIKLEDMGSSIPVRRPFSMAVMDDLMPYKGKFFGNAHSNDYMSISEDDIGETIADTISNVLKSIGLYTPNIFYWPIYLVTNENAVGEEHKLSYIVNPKLLPTSGWQFAGFAYRAKRGFGPININHHASSTQPLKMLERDFDIPMNHGSNAQRHRKGKAVVSNVVLDSEWNDACIKKLEKELIPVEIGANFGFLVLTLYNDGERVADVSGIKATIDGVNAGVNRLASVQTQCAKNKIKIAEINELVNNLISDDNKEGLLEDGYEVRGGIPSADWHIRAPWQFAGVDDRISFSWPNSIIREEHLRDNVDDTIKNVFSNIGLLIEEFKVVPVYKYSKNNDQRHFYLTDGSRDDLGDVIFVGFAYIHESDFHAPESSPHTNESYQAGLLQVLEDNLSMISLLLHDRIISISMSNKKGLYESIGFVEKDEGSINLAVFELSNKISMTALVNPILDF